MIQEQVCLAPFTSYKIGGPARYYCEPTTIAEVQEALALSREKGLELFILGKGSNILVSDDGFDGMVINFSQLKKMTFTGNRLVAEAGIKFSRMIMELVKRGLGGIEKLAGIPGTLGGAIIMNAGAYGPTISEVVESVTWIDRESGELFTSTKEELTFGYRTSSLKDIKGIVLSVEMAFEESDAAALVAEVEAIQEKRKASQPLNFPSCGSVFKRPPGNYAGALIEGSCLKGKRIGGAQVSPKHANFFVNLGGATASDVRALISHCRRHVYIDTNAMYLLEPEVIFVGEFAEPLWSPDEPKI